MCSIVPEAYQMWLKERCSNQTPRSLDLCVVSLLVKPHVAVQGHVANVQHMVAKT